MKTFIKTAVSVSFAALAFVAIQASACGGNFCNHGNNTQSVDTFTGGGGNFGASGSGHNYSFGSQHLITSRNTISESDGFVNTYGRAARDECGNCEDNSLAAKAEGGAFQRNYSGISTDSGHSSSSVHGGASFNANAFASRSKSSSHYDY
jgi:hypothetical protein